MKKRFISLLLALVMIFGAVAVFEPMTAEAAGEIVEPYTRDDFKYHSLDANTILGFSDAGKEKLKRNGYHLEIPEGTTNILDNAFRYESIKSVKLPESIKRIEDFAFEHNNIEKVNLPKNLEFIGWYTFDDNQIEELYFEGDTQLDGGAFSDNNLTSVTLPRHLQTIRFNTFAGNNLESIDIPETVTSISEGAFANNKLKSLKLPDNLESLNMKAFKNNEISGELVIPKKLESIRTNTFSNNKIQKVTFLGNTEFIGAEAFMNNEIESVNLPTGLREFQYNAFKNNKLTEINLPVTLTKLSGGVFANNNLKRIDFPDNFKKIPYEFVANNNLEEINFPADAEIGNDAFFGQELELTPSTSPFALKYVTVNGERIPWADNARIASAGNDQYQFADTSTNEVHLSVVREDLELSADLKINSAGSAAPVEPEVPSENVTADLRISGNDRVSTSVEISKKYFDDTTENVVIAQPYVFADSLSASVLAKQLGAPILLAPKDGNDAALLAELKRLNPSNVYIIGGTASISKAAENTLKSYGTVTRISGKDRFETSYKIAQEVLKRNGDLDQVVVASGLVFADALSIAPYAASNELPILLVQKDRLPADMGRFIKDNAVDKALVVGGKGSVSGSVENAISANTERISGKDRYTTSKMIMEQYMLENHKEVFVASGEVFADALAIGPVAGMENSPILLSPANGLYEGSSTLIEKAKTINPETRLVLVGGKAHLNID